MSRDREDDESKATFGETAIYKRSKAAIDLISEKTSVPIRVILPLATVLLFSTYRITSAINRVERSLEATLTVNVADKWVRQLQRDNPSLKIPDLRELFDAEQRNIKLLP